MPEKHSKFHDFALKSILFKGRSDWYFCYLKGERIAHVLVALCEVSDPAKRDSVADVAHRALGLPPEIAHLAAGEVDAPIVLADVFGLLSAVRGLAVRKAISEETAGILVQEYEHLAQRLVQGSHPSPFASADDFAITGLPAPGESGSLLRRTPETHIGQGVIKDTQGHKGQNERMSLILDFIKKNKRASIKDIAAVITGCSEKTLQRELGNLIRDGLVRKIGERRWSVYVPV